MARFASVLKHFFHVNDDAVIDDMEMKQDAEGVKSVYIDVHPYKRYLHRCPHCGKRCPGYDMTSPEPRTWRALDCAGILVYLRYAPPRVCCPDHGVVTSAVPWAFPDSRFTKEFDLQVAWLAKYQTQSSVREFMRIDWRTVGRCVARAQQHLDPDGDKRRLNGLVSIGVDETSYRKGHKYMTVVVNHDTGEVVWVHDKHGKTVFEQFFKDLTPEQRSSIRYVTGDGAKWIDECLAEYAPQATRCVDPFHVVQWAGDALNAVRVEQWQALRIEARALLAELKKEKSIDKASETAKDLKKKHEEQEQLAKDIKGSTYALGKAPENLTQSQVERLTLVAKSQPRLFRAYGLKEQLRLILKMPFEEAEFWLKKWHWRASHSRIQAFRDLADKIKRHRTNILNTIKYGLSNARIEAINNKIGVLVRRSYGFRKVENMFAFIKLMCSNIEIPLPNRPKSA